MAHPRQTQRAAADEAKVERAKVEPGVTHQAVARLDIYVMEHCDNCRYAVEMAAWIAQQYPKVVVQVIYLEHTTAPIPESVFATPTYLLDGRVWSLGNPSHAQVVQTLGPTAD
jgi:hypothetical protein